MYLSQRETSKLPRETLLQLEILKGTTERCTVKKLRELMKGYITVKVSSEPPEYQEASCMRIL